MFYVGVNYTANLKGSTAVTVNCEQCGRSYYYQLLCSAVGTDHAPFGLGAERAEARVLSLARKELRQMLQSEVAPVPCPECGHYQKNMLPPLRKQRLRWLKILGIAAVAVAGSAAICVTLLAVEASDRAKNGGAPDSGIAWEVPAAILLSGIAVLIVRYVLNAAYNPNNPQTERERIEIGRQYTITKEQPEAIWAQGQG